MHSADMAMEALRECQSALAMMIAPDAIKQTTVISAFAQATAAEAKARTVLSALASSPETARDRAERRVSEQPEILTDLISLSFDDEDGWAYAIRAPGQNFVPGSHNMNADPHAAIAEMAAALKLGDIERAQSSGERAGKPKTIGVIAHIDHSKHALTAAIAALSRPQADDGWRGMSEQPPKAGPWFLSQAWSARPRADGQLEPGFLISGNGISYEPMERRSGALEMQRYWLETLGRIKAGEPFFYIDAPFRFDAGRTALAEARDA